MLMVTASVNIPSSLPTALPAMSVDAMIVAAIALVITYSLVAGHAALVRESISIYVGLVLASSFGKTVYEVASKNASENSIITQTLVNLILLILPVILLQFGRLHSKTHHKHRLVITLILATAAALLLASSVLVQLDPRTLTEVTQQSNLAAWLYELRLVWLASVPVAIAASALIKPKDHHR